MRSFIQECQACELELTGLSSERKHNAAAVGRDMQAGNGIVFGHRCGSQTEPKRCSPSGVCSLFATLCLHTAVRVRAFNEHARVHTWGRHITKAPVTFRLRENALSDCQEKGKTVLEIKDANDLGWFQVMLLRMQLSKSRSGSKRIT